MQAFRPTRQCWYIIGGVLGFWLLLVLVGQYTDWVSHRALVEIFLVSLTALALGVAAAGMLASMENRVGGEFPVRPPEEDQRGRDMICPGCRQVVPVPAVPRESRGDGPPDSLSPLVRIVAALLVGGFLATLGYLLAQYRPFLASAAARAAEPYSEVRNQLARQYALIGAILGVLLGLMARQPRWKGVGD